MILSQVRQTIEKYGMLSPGDRVIVGVSGGMDSLALLSVLNRISDAYGLTLTVAHLNHGLRGEESHRDELFVTELARKLSLPCETQSVRVRDFIKKGMTLQEAARGVRFSFFRTLVQKHNAEKVALGQNADDQAETMVMRFIRGAGLGGLKGIPPVRNEIVHPLIEVSREAIKTYLMEQGLTHVEDSSNQKDVYLRNRIRRHLIPLLERYNPNLKASLGRMSRILLQEDQYMQEQAEEIWTRFVQCNQDTVSLDLREFRSLHPAIQFRLLKRCVDSLGGIEVKKLGVTHVLNLAELASRTNPSASLHLPGGLRGRRCYDQLEITRGESPTPPRFDYDLALPGITPIFELNKRIVTEFLDQWDLERGSVETTLMDFGRLNAPLRVRNFRQGDRFRPLGMTGTKKIKDCFIDWKVPVDKRLRIPLVCSGETIVWVVGHRISHEARVSRQTKRVIRMAFQDL